MGKYDSGKSTESGTACPACKSHGIPHVARTIAYLEDCEAKKKERSRILNSLPTARVKIIKKHEIVSVNTKCKN